MKKAGLILLFLIFITSFANSQNNNSIVQDIGKLKYETNFTNDFLNNKLELPSYISPILYYLTGIKEDSTISFLIVGIFIWLAILVIIKGVIELTPFHNEESLFGLSDWIISLIIVVLISITGVLNFATNSFISMTNFFGLIVSNSILNNILKVFLLLIILYLIRFATKKIKFNLEMEKAKDDGRKISFLSKTAKINAEEIDKLGEN